MIEKLKELKELLLESSYNTPMAIICYNIEELDIIADTICDAGRKRMIYDVFKEPGYYMVEIRFVYKAYLDFMYSLRKKGYNLKPLTKVDLINVLIKEA